MIARITGLLIEKAPPLLVIDVGGVGYECQAPITTCATCTEGALVTLFTRLLHRDDGQSLYGFTSRQERDLFSLVLKVNGVGPKSALGILSAMDPLTLVRAIEYEEVGMLTKIPGIGKKTAAKIVLDLKDKMESFKDLASSLNSTVLLRPSEVQQAVQALVSLGYKAGQVTRSVEALAKLDPNLSCEALVKLSLQQMGNGSTG